METKVPDREIVAVRPQDNGSCTHVIKVKRVDSSDNIGGVLLAAVPQHEAHYVMRPTSSGRPVAWCAVWPGEPSGSSG